MGEREGLPFVSEFPEPFTRASQKLQVHPIKYGSLSSGLLFPSFQPLPHCSPSLEGPRHL